jgi:hypothetical protein
MTLLHDHARSGETTCYRTPPRPALQPPLRVQIAEELQRAHTTRSLHEPIDPILLGVLIVVATVAAGLLLGGLWSFAATHPFPLDVPYYVT